jgi:diacylglycerol O-acyltransferase / wax synthase
MRARERMSGVDTAWLRMETPTNLMMIVGVMTFARPLDIATVRRIVAERFLAFSRFRSRAVQDAAGAWWETDAEADLEWHVRKHRARGRLGKAALETLVSELASTPLDFSRPLWQFHLVDYGTGSALVSRIHHCYADGIALIQVMLSMTHATAEGSLAASQAPSEGESPSEADFWGQILKPVTSAVGSATRLGREVLDQGIPDVTRRGVDLAAEVARLLTMGKDASTRYRGELGTRKRTAWATPLPLDEVKAVGKALGGSINDVLLSMATGALRTYLDDRGDPVDGVEIRAIVPVNLRPLTQAGRLGNHFGLVFLALPVGIEHPLERLYAIRARMNELKGSYQPLIALGILGAVGYGPRILQDQVTQLLGQNASVVMTNVPGPQHPLYFAGGRIEEINFWVPQSGGIGMGVSILSYDGRIHFGVVTDAGLVPDPDRIVGRFAAEFEKLLWITLMSPWGDGAAARRDPPAQSRPSRPGSRSGAARRAPRSSQDGDRRTPRRKSR